MTQAADICYCLKSAEVDFNNSQVNTVVCYSNVGYNQRPNCGWLYNSARLTVTQILLCC